eukprot:scaffold94627_cov53-Attheya_sp.AAC.3
MIGLLGATITVAATTADDAVWLVPYAASPSIPVQIRVVHGLLFVGTLEFLAIASVVAAKLIQHASLFWSGPSYRQDVVLEMVGAVSCWAIAIFLYVKKMLKRRRKALALALAVDTSVTGNYGTIESSAQQDSFDDHEAEETKTPKEFSPWTVISLTTLGALDEMCYFPALVVGNIFTPFQLCAGTLFAACLILAVVVFFLARCKPILDFLDRIPLHGTVTLFAMVLTLGVVFDMFHPDDTEQS